MKIKINYWELETEPGTEPNERTHVSTASIGMEWLRYLPAVFTESYFESSPIRDIEKEWRSRQPIYGM